MTPRNPVTPPEFFSHQVGEARRVCLDLHPSREKALAVVCCGLERCAPDYAIERTSFPYFGIEYVVRGRGTLKLGSTQCALKAGYVFAYNSTVPHRIKTDPRDPLVKYFVDFAGRRAAALLKSCRLEAGSIAQVFPPDCAAALFEELIQTGMQARTNAGELCSRLLECLTLKIETVSTPPKEAESRSFAAYVRCRSFIEQNFLQMQTLEQIADACDLDKAYVCRLFRRFDHQSPYQYLLRLKINFAAAELQKPGALVKDVAAAIGFDDSFHFSRVFRSILGSSPAQFRRLR